MIYGLLVTWAITAAVLVLVGWLLWKMPDRTRPSLFFAVTVPPEFRQTPEAAEITADYRWRIRQHTIIAVALLVMVAGAALALGERPATEVLFLVSLLGPLGWLIFGSFLALLAARQAVLPYAVRPTRVREAPLRPSPPRRSHILLNALALLSPLLILAVSAIYLWLRWADIPPRFPTHWGPSGQVDGWSTRTPMGVFGPLLSALAVYIPLTILAWILPRARRVATTGPAAARENRFRQWTQAALLVTINLLIAIIAIMAVWLPFRNSEELPVNMVAIALTIALGATAIGIALSLRAGQGGYRLPVPGEPPPGQTETPAPPVGDSTLDEHWIGGVIYYNPDDPSVLVEKRFGIGWTFNMARLATYLIILALIVPVIVIVTVLTRFASDSGQKNTRPAASAPQAGAVSQRSNFVTDPNLIGTWQSIDFVDQIADFNPAARKWQGDLYFKGLELRKNGTTSPQGWRWTQGQITTGPNDPHPARYEIRRIDGRPYLFFEWISGDVTIRGMNPSYYVLEKTGPQEQAKR